MDENNNTENKENMTPQQPVESAGDVMSVGTPSAETPSDEDGELPAESSPQSKSEPTVIVSGGAASSVEYATFMQRFVAVFIDGFIFFLLAMLFGFIFGDDNVFGSLIGLLAWVYAVFMLVKYGATLGKMAVGIKVQDINTGENIDYISAILREVVGKLLSSAIFSLGYLWMFWDNNKQCWHDKLAKSIVVKAK